MKNPSEAQVLVNEDVAPSGDDAEGALRDQTGHDLRVFPWDEAGISFAAMEPSEDHARWRSMERWFEVEQRPGTQRSRGEGGSAIS